MMQLVSTQGNENMNKVKTENDNKCLVNNIPVTLFSHIFVMRSEGKIHNGKRF